MTKRAVSTCHLCEANCGIIVEHDGNQILTIRGDDDDPLSQGYICPKAAALADLHHDADRLRRPVARTSSGEWRELPWDEALDQVADRLAAIRAEHGRDSIALHLGNPTIHSYSALLYGYVFRNALRTRNFFTSNSVDVWPRLLTSYLMYGSHVVLPVPDIDRTDYMLILGANPAVSNGSLMTAPGAKKRLRAIRARAGRVVVIDPRHTETARLADQHLFIRPETDAYFLASMVHVILTENLANPGRLAELFSSPDVLQQLRRLVADFAPGRVAPAVGIAADDIVRLAREFARARSAVCYGRLGTCIQEFGTLTSWLIDCLNIITGNFDRPGGAMFPRPAIDLLRLAPFFGQRGHFGRWRTRVSGLPELSGEVPAVALAEEIETAGPGQIRALITHASNPVLSLPNGARLERALNSLDFMVAIDIYKNETTRHADIILPPTFGLERGHYSLVFSALSVRNGAKYSPAVFAKSAGARHDWEILLALSRRFLAHSGFLGKLGGAALDRLAGAGPETLLRVALRVGPHRVSLADLRDHPHGVDLGPLEPRLPGVLAASSIDLAPAPMVSDLVRLRATLAGRVHAGEQARSDNGTRADHAGTGDGAAAQAQNGDSELLKLIGRRQLSGNNSWMHNSRKLVKRGDRCSLLIHPSDARARGIGTGDRVEITSRTGAIEAPVEVTDEMMPGVVSLPHGWGHHRSGIELSHASAHPGVSLNDVTDDELFDELSGCARYAVSVRVARVTGERV
ncbi:MAG: molybdopterin-dependent oxidoreductase [Proteobacteria bacterium]|nr:molybdopterin-dependent oxidoreductase [Pseudomonadota bacterium]